MKFHSFVLTSAILMFAASTAQATPITYNVHETVGAGGITGTITTDGATGILTLGDLTSWNLTVNDGTNSFDLTGAIHVYVVGPSLSATATQLFFNFSGGGFFLFQNDSNGLYACWASSATNCYHTDAITLDAFGGNGYGNPYVTMTGNQVIGSTSVSVPEPGTLALFGAALLGLGGLGLRRKFI